MCALVCMCGYVGACCVCVHLCHSVSLPVYVHVCVYMSAVSMVSQVNSACVCVRVYLYICVKGRPVRVYQFVRVHICLQVFL